ncbi:VOC family protein [Nocardioides bizhenqiangii]|uniref:VOC family protein n=1 Tax=Nocardioides bizhenqiangii TaxID=3095076 RepID=A0ABZ0ZKV8_9ACTN|nr:MULTISPECIES: VOC family protein [unclassified Nocardioides]MDZ5620631.1 VOC family protein [Nocardioides sp. HM23]WQQ24999.1 VOC family protein [Nocardioides sp. HM61]
MTGRIVHFEIPFDDGDRARDFYGNVFGWQLMHMPEMDYTMAMTGPSDPESGPSEPGFINGGLFQREEGFTGPVVVIDVPDIDAALASVEAAGGKVGRPKEAVGDMGFAAYFSDTEGNLVGLWETAT